MKKDLSLILASGIISAGAIIGCAKYDIQREYKDFKNVEGIVINKTDNTINKDTIIYGIRISTPQGTFDYYDKNLYDSLAIGSKVSLDCKIEYITSIPRKNKSNCNTKYLEIQNHYNNIKCLNKDKNE